MAMKRLVQAILTHFTGLVPQREPGQAMAEYGLILAGVALLAIVAVFSLGPKIGNLLNRVGASLS